MFLLYVGYPTKKVLSLAIKSAVHWSYTGLLHPLVNSLHFVGGRDLMCLDRHHVQTPVHLENDSSWVVRREDMVLETDRDDPFSIVLNNQSDVDAWVFGLGQ